MAAERSRVRRAVLAAAITTLAAGCSSGADTAPGAEQADRSCAERAIVLSAPADEGTIAITIVGTSGGSGDGDELARAIMGTLEAARVGADLSDRVTSVGAGELADSGFVLPAGPGCQTAVTFDPDVGADSASLRFVQLQIDSPSCDVVRFRTILIDSAWVLDGVTPPPTAALDAACGAAD